MVKKPLLLVVMDGIGINESKHGNAVTNSYTPTLDYLKENYPNIEIKAHGLSVGLPSDDDMGNSEVGHNALGCGQIYSQGAKLVNESIADKSIFESPTWKELVAAAKDHTMHFIGLLSDGNVHSNISHLEALIEECKIEGVKKVRVHALMDGRDVPATSGLTYIKEIEDFMNALNDDTFDARIASGGGRMYITMDRYNADWSMVDRGWKTHVHGEGRKFNSATEAIETYRSEGNEADQDLHEFVIVENDAPIGTIEDGDAVVYFNFRGDRAIEISRAFEEKDFNEFDRGRVPNVVYAGMLEYDGDLHIPSKFLVFPPSIKHTLTEFLVNKDVKMYAISETQKFGHMTYFWNGNNSQKFSEKLETWVEVPSDVIPFEQRPWMKSAEITDKLVDAIASEEYDFLRVNYPNGDMVGHTGNYEATIIGVESVDLALKRLYDVCVEHGVQMIITADHGNADEMYEKSKDPSKAPKPKTSHTLNHVPFIIVNSDYKLDDKEFGLSNVAATAVEMMGFEPDTNWKPSMLKK